tara:strand:+ start:15296 stop:15667 length:372 start_codon:yes stop_codon:yes gene_type:complete
MSEAVKDLINNAIGQDYNDANKTFMDIMSVKMTDVLDQEKIRLADQIYNGVEDAMGDEDDVMGDEDGAEQLDLDLEGEDESESGGETEEEELESDDDEEEEAFDSEEDLDDDIEEYEEDENES